MLTLVFSITTLICAFGWLLYWVGAAALAKHMMDKGYTAPTDEEMKACCMYVWKHLLHMK